MVSACAQRGTEQRRSNDGIPPPAQLPTSANPPLTPIPHAMRAGPGRDVGLCAEGARAVVTGLAGRAGFEALEALDLGSAPAPTRARLHFPGPRPVAGRRPPPLPVQAGQ